jgi:hypothetical protein
MRLKVAQDPFNPVTERQLLLGFSGRRGVPDAAERIAAVVGVSRKKRARLHQQPRAPSVRDARFQITIRDSPFAPFQLAIIN